MRARSKASRTGPGPARRTLTLGVVPHEPTPPPHGRQANLVPSETDDFLIARSGPSGRLVFAASGSAQRFANQRAARRLDGLADQDLHFAEQVGRAMVQRRARHRNIFDIDGLDRPRPVEG